MVFRWIARGVLAVTFFASSAAAAQIVAVGIDRSMVNRDGVVSVAPDQRADSVMFLAPGADVPRTVGQIEVPVSAAGPPATIAISADARMALVTSGQSPDAESLTPQLMPSDLVSLIDLSGARPRVAHVAEAEAGAAGAAFTPDGRLALIANRNAGTLSVFVVDEMRLVPVDTLRIGEPGVGVSGIAVTPDGTMALATLDGANGISVFDIKGTRVTRRAQFLTAGVRPYGITISPDGRLAAVGNMGRTDGDVDTVSLVDLTADPVRVANTVAVGIDPEAVVFSPDGQYLAVVLQNGSQVPPDEPFYNKGGRLAIYAVDGTALRKLDDSTIGAWPQGAAFSPDGGQIYVETMGEGVVQIFNWDGRDLVDSGERIQLDGGGAAMAASY